jgi:hypothetical protein
LPTGLLRQKYTYKLEVNVSDWMALFHWLNGQRCEQELVDGVEEEVGSTGQTLNIVTELIRVTVKVC